MAATTRETEGPYPLVFRVQIPVQGRDFSGRVEFSGGAVVTAEDGSYVAHGLRPGGVCGLGETLVESHLDLKENIELALYDLAEDAADFPHFKELVAQFFKDEDEWARAQYDKGRELVASGAVSADLPTRTSPVLRHKVVRFDRPKPANNPKPVNVSLASSREAA